MSLKDKDYEIVVKACKEAPWCYYPESGDFHSGIANTPEWVRRFFMSYGREAFKLAAKKELKEFSFYNRQYKISCGICKQKENILFVNKHSKKLCYSCLLNEVFG